MSEVAWQSDTRGLRLIHRREPSAALVDLLERTVWGEAEVKYSVCDVGRVLARIPDPHYLTLETEAGELVGGLVAGRKRTVVKGRVCQAVHVAMISIEPSMAGRGLGLTLARQSKAVLRDLIGDAGLVYLFVETTHHASIALHRRLGYRDVTTINARLFARLSPDDSPRVERLPPARRAEMTALLEAAYAGHALTDFDVSVVPAETFMATDAGRVLAAADASPMRWQLRELEGAAGYATLHILPHLPMISQAFDPTDFRFIRFANLYAAPGEPAVLAELMEAVLARESLHAGIVFEDERSPVTASLGGEIGSGIIPALVVGSAAVLADFKGLDETEISWFLSAPQHISAIDAI